MNEVIVSYKTAKLAEQEMFTLDTIAYYRRTKYSYEHKYITSKLFYRNISNYNKERYESELVNAPTQNQLIKWLYDKHNIFIQTLILDGPKFEISINYITKDGFISVLGIKESNYKEYYNNLEKSIYTALTKVQQYTKGLEILKNKLMVI